MSGNVGRWWEEPPNPARNNPGNPQRINQKSNSSLNTLTRAPYGYRLIRKTETCGARFEIDETEAGVVRRIFDLYAGEGLKMHQIARQLDEEDLSPRHSRHWSISTVAVILRNEAYIGKAAYLKTTGSGQRVRHSRTGRQKGGAVRRLTGRVTRPREDWIELPVPAIVDPALFARAQRQREANRRFSERKTVEPTLLQGLCVCAHCGYAMGRNSGNSSRKTPRLHYYRCHGTEGWRHPEGAVCDNPAVRADELDAAVWTEVLALIEDPDLIQGEITRRLEAANDTTDIRQRTDSLQGELGRITTRMRRLLDAYQEEVMTLDELREAKTPLQARQDSIQSELRSLKAAELDRGARLSLAASAEQFLGRLREGGRSLSLAERQRIVRLPVREVRVGKDAVTICHSIPIPASPPHGSDPSGDKPGQGKLLDSRCRQVVDQDVEPRVEQRRPSLAQEGEERLPVRGQLVEAAVQRVRGDRPVAADQVAQGAVLEPVAVEAPLAPGIDQPVAGQNLQHVQPARALPARGQARLPEPVQLQPVPQGQGQPARPPLARVVQRHSRDVDLHHLAVQRRRLPILGKQRHLPQFRPAFQHLDRAAPRRALAVVDLAEIQDLSLHDPAAAHAAVFDHAPVAVLLAVLESLLAAHEHERRLRRRRFQIKGVGRHYTRLPGVGPLKTRCFPRRNPPN